MRNIIVTGGTGFIGNGLVSTLASSTINDITVTTRHAFDGLPSGVKAHVIREIDSNTNWTTALAGKSVVIHTAARVHVLKETSSDSLSAFRDTNVKGTIALAREAAKNGIRRFVFISSVKVNGEATELGHPYSADTPPAPQDAYGVSKYEAELSLRNIAHETGMEVVIIRPVLVYGPGVKANFLNMMKWLYMGVPLPLGAIHNKRSLVALDNLVDLIVTCIDHPRAANQTFLVSDGEDLSTTELLQRMSKALSKRPRLLPVPAWMLETAAKVVGRQSIAQRLCGSLQVDIAHTRETLGWTPPVSIDAALQKTAQHFLEQQKQ